MPRNNLVQQGAPLRENILVQRFPESKLLDFGLTLVEETWNAINDTQSPTEMVDSFKKYSKEMVDSFFFSECCSVRPYGQAFLH